MHAELAVSYEIYTLLFRTFLYLWNRKFGWLLEEYSMFMIPPQLHKHIFYSRGLQYLGWEEDGEHLPKQRLFEKQMRKMKEKQNK